MVRAFPGALLCGLLACAPADAATTVTMLGKGWPVSVVAEPGGDSRVAIRTWKSLRETRVPAAGPFVSSMLVPSPRCVGWCDGRLTPGGGAVYATDTRPGRRAKVRITTQRATGVATTQTFASKRSRLAFDDLAASASGAAAVEFSEGSFDRWAFRAVGASRFGRPRDVPDPGFSNATYDDGGHGALVTIPEANGPQLVVRRVATDGKLGRRVVVESRGRNVLDFATAVAPDGTIGIEWFVRTAGHSSWDLNWSTLAIGAAKPTTSLLWRGKLIRDAEGVFEQLDARSAGGRWLLAAGVTLGQQPSVQVRESIAGAPPIVAATYPVTAAADGIVLATRADGIADVVWSDRNDDATGAIVRGHRSATGTWGPTSQILWSDDQEMSLGEVAARPDGGLVAAYEAGSISATFVLRTDD